jgi:hypothetical protein
LYFQRIFNVIFAHLRIQDMMEKNQAFVMTGLHAKLLEAQDECLRQASLLDAETKERKRQEQRNNELNAKLAEARQGLRDTQHALQNVQQAMEQAFIKRDQKEILLQKVQAENKQLLDRVGDLESRLKDAEGSAKLLVAGREALMEQLKEQLSVSQDSLHKQHAETLRLRGEKTLLEAENDSSKRKIASLETRFKNVEGELRTEYQMEIDRLTEKLKIAAEKLEHVRVNEAIVAELYDEIKEKSNLIKVLEGRNADLDASKRDIEIKHATVEGHYRANENTIQQLQIQLRQYEQDISTSQNDVISLKRSLTHSEDMLKEVAFQLQKTHSEKDILKETIASSESKLLRMNDLQDSTRRLKRDLDRAMEDNDELNRRLAEQERTVRIYNEDRLGAESQYKVLQTRLNAAVSSEQEARHLLAEANNRIAELFNTASDLSNKLTQSMQRTERMEREQALQTISTMNSLAYASELHASTVHAAGSGAYSPATYIDENGDIGDGSHRPAPPGSTASSSSNTSPRTRGSYGGGNSPSQYNYPAGGRVYGGQYAQPSPRGGGPTYPHPRGPPTPRAAGRPPVYGGPPAGRVIPGRMGARGPITPRSSYSDGNSSHGQHGHPQDGYYHPSSSVSVPHSASSGIHEDGERPYTDSAMPQPKPNRPMHSHPESGHGGNSPAGSVSSDHSNASLPPLAHPGSSTPPRTHGTHSQASATTQPSHSAVLNVLQQHSTDDNDDVVGDDSSSPSPNKHHHHHHHESQRSSKHSHHHGHSSSHHDQPVTPTVNTDHANDVAAVDGSTSSKTNVHHHHHRGHHANEDDADQETPTASKSHSHHSHHHSHHHSSKHGATPSPALAIQSETAAVPAAEEPTTSAASALSVAAEDTLGSAVAAPTMASVYGRSARGPIVAGDVTQLRSLFGKVDESQAGGDGSDFGLGLVDGDHEGNAVKLERFLKHSDKILEDMKVKQSKYQEEMSKTIQDFEAQNGRKPSNEEIPKDLLTKSAKV